MLRSARNVLRNKWVRRGASSILGILLTAIVVGTALEYRARRSAFAEFPAPGQFIEVEGGPLHLHCIGDGEPTVILEAGASQPSVAWSQVQGQVAKVTRACSYDRAGVGWSLGAGGDTDPERMVHRLREALQNAGISPPFVLVGHSIGGPLAMIFGDLYPDETTGYVFVDSADPDRFEMTSVQLTSPPPVAQTLAGAMSRATARVGLTRWQMRGVRKPDHWPDSVFRVAVAFAPHSGPTGTREQLAAPTIVRRASEVASFGSQPVVVLTAESSLRNSGAPMTAEEWAAIRLEMQRAIAARSDNSAHRIVEDVGHNIHLDDPETTTQAIVDVVTAVREGAPVPSGQ